MRDVALFPMHIRRATVKVVQPGTFNKEGNSRRAVETQLEPPEHVGQTEVKFAIAQAVATVVNGGRGPESDELTSRRYSSWDPY